MLIRSTTLFFVQVLKKKSITNEYEVVRTSVIMVNSYRNNFKYRF